MSNISNAIILACNIHKDQVDKSGQPYILHPIRLMLKFSSEEERIAAVLHDVIEDGDISEGELRALGYSEEVINAVSCLTKRPDEPYEEFIKRLSSNPLAKKVKIADLKDNLDITRLRTVTDRDLVRIQKYHKALIYLTERKD